MSDEIFASIFMQVLLPDCGSMKKVDERGKAKIVSRRHKQNMKSIVGNRISACWI